MRAAEGADYHGFVVATGTRRSLLVHQAGRLMARAARPTVAVTTSADPDFIASVAKVLRPHAVQLNGPVGKSAVQRLRSTIDCEIWMTVHIGHRAPEPDRGSIALVDCVVLDTASPDGGGSGAVHDHCISARLARTIEGKVSLAGGLTPENVEAAIRAVRPDIVDVSSGVESGGVKDALKIERFVGKVRTC